MNFAGVTKNVGKIQKSITYWLSTILIWFVYFWKVDYDALDKWIFFFIISMDLILFIFLYLRNITKTTIMMPI
jgi:hypothetical protein